MTESATLTLPAELLPKDGRFGSGPSKVRPEQVEYLASLGTTVLGTSHRQAPVKNLVSAVREGISELFSLPDGYEVVLGNGGSTAFWDIAAFGLVRERAQHLSFGEFSSKFASVTSKAPFLGDSTVIKAEPGSLAAPVAEAGVDVYAWPHNETSTGVMAPVQRVAGRRRRCPRARRRHVRAPAACPWTSPSPTSTTSARRSASPPTAGSGWPPSPPRPWPGSRRSPRRGAGCPTSSRLPTAIDNSRKNQTYNTPAVGTLALLKAQLEWINGQGGLEWAVKRTADSSGGCTTGPSATAYTTPYVANPAHRSQVVTTIDFADDVDASAIAKTLRANGVVDVEPYRKLGRNQLRVATFPAVEPDDVSALIACIEHIVGQG